MKDHITKPIDPDRMFKIMEKYYHKNKAAISSARKRKFDVKAAVPAAASSIPDIPGIDTASGLKRTAGNGKLYLNILKKFMDNYADVPGNIYQALAADDRKLAERLAHTVKGVAGNIGAVGVQEMAQELEQSIRQNDSAGQTEQIRKRFADVLMLQIANLRANLGDVREENQFAPARVVDPGLMKTMITKLETLLMADDTEALDYFESVEKELSAVLPAADYNNLRKSTY